MKAKNINRLTFSDGKDRLACVDYAKWLEKNKEADKRTCKIKS